MVEFGSKRKVLNLAFTEAGNVHDLSDVANWAKPVAASLVTAAVHMSPGDKANVKSKRSSELAAPRKRTLTSLPLVVSVLVMLSNVALAPWAEK